MTINTKAMIEVADLIEKQQRFNLGTFLTGLDGDDEIHDETAAMELLHNCNTVGCFAGWTNALDGAVEAANVEAAAAKLGLTEREADSLFFGFSSDSVWDGIDFPFQITADQAATMLREIAAGTRTFGRRP